MSKFTTLMAAAVLMMSFHNANGELITFASADPTSTGTVTTARADGNTPVYGTTNSSTDLLWRYRTGQAISLGGIAMETQDAVAGTENAYEMVTTISGLTPGTAYSIYAYYDYQPNWDIQFGFQSGNLTDYGGDAGVSGRDYGIPLGGLNASSHFSNLSGTIAATVLTRELSLGTVVADASGQIKVYFDDSSVGNKEISGSDARSRCVGVGYSMVPEPSMLAMLAMGLAGLLAYAWRKR